MDKKSREINIEFENLSYTVKSQTTNSKLTILKSISGTFKYGELTAIMGPSGAGKSSLLNILTGFTRTGVDGYVNLLEKRKNGYKYKKLCSYILQEDHLFSTFTVQETMMLAANLKIGGIKKDGKELMIENILNTLNLTCTKNTYCDKLSGGQRKRLSIALELIDNPPVLILDEPTTGLDSSASLYCIEMLRNLAMEGRTIICTIHQPAATIYTMFNHVYVLGDGHCVYQGSPDNTINYLSSAGLQCPQYHNPADFLMEIVAGEYGDFIKHLSEHSTENQLRYRGPFITHTKLISSKENNGNNVISVNEITSSKSSVMIYPSPSEWDKFWTLVGRCVVHYFRDWTVTHLKLLMHILCGILMGFIYGDSGMNANKSISNVGLLLVGIVYLWYTTMMPSILKFPTEIAVVKKEIFNNWYNLRTYYFANLFITTPIHITFSTVFSTILFLMTQQPLEMDRFLKYTLAYVLLTVAADSFGLVIGAITDPINGTFIGAICTCFKLAFCGFLVLWDHTPKFMYIFTHVSTHSYSMEALIISLHGNGRSDLYCPYDDDLIYCHYKNPKLIINLLGMNHRNYDYDIFMIFFQIMLFKGLAYVLLKRRLNKS